jgi:hypothetical protein
MVEMIAIFGCVGWLLLLAGEWLKSLPCFPALLLAAILVPLLAHFDYRSLARAWRLRGIETHRSPIPPERFYWAAQQKRTRRLIQVSTLVAISSWTNVFLLPASSDWTIASVLGWANAAIAIAATSRLTSATALFFRASQWFDTMRPTVVGMMRMAMYKLSDNYEYLGPQKRNLKREKVY